MSALRYGFIIAPVLGLLWSVTMATTVAVSLAFATGLAVTPGMLTAGLSGAAAGLIMIRMFGRLNPKLIVGCLGALLIIAQAGLRAGEPFGIPLDQSILSQILAVVIWAVVTIWPLSLMLDGIEWGGLDRHSFEHAIIRFLTAFGYVFFIVIVAIPFYVMVMTSLKSQQALLANALDFSIDFHKGWGLFRSYSELFGQFNFGRYLGVSFFVSVMTVFITLLFSIPGAYAIARLRFEGRAMLSRSILLIYMVPMIVLALPIYIGFSMAGLRNSLFGILLIYPVTTIPVALYMLQGYFRGLPGEVEEAGLMDGLSRLAVIWKITLPLSLPALASVSLYVFMIAWNEFLLAFMLLDDPSKFTLTRGVAMLNSSEIPRQHLMAGAVIATVPIMVLFLGLERFMTKGLTAGSVKG